MLYATEKSDRQSELFIAGYRLDQQLQSIQIGNEHIRLRNKIWEVFLYFVKHKGILVSREYMIENFWDGNTLSGERGVTHTICQLRRIFKQLGIDAKIVTISKRGYVLQERQT